MKKAQKNSRPAGAKIQMETITDAQDTDIAAHIPVLLETIGNLKLEKIDLTTEDSSKEAIAMLDNVIDKLATYKKTASALRQIIESNDNLPKKH